jgi:hypothetical protein
LALQRVFFLGYFYCKQTAGQGKTLFIVYYAQCNDGRIGFNTIYVPDLDTGTGIAKRENGAARYTCRYRAGIHDIVI